MRITFLLTQSLESPGGGGRYLPLAKALTRIGHQVTLIALHHDYTHTQPLRFVLDHIDVWYVAQMHVHKSGSLKTYYGTSTLLWITTLAILKLVRAAYSVPSDVIHICKAQPMNAIAAWCVHQLRGTPVYLDSDDCEALNNRFVHRWQQRIVAWFENWIPTFARGITVSNTYLSRCFQLQGYPIERIQVVPHGIDVEQFAVLKRSDLPEILSELKQSLYIANTDRVVVYVGSMSLVNHALELLLEAFAEVYATERSALLLMVGGGEDMDVLRRITRNLGICERIRFAGRVAREQVPLYFRLGELSVDAKRETTVAHSSLSLKLIESIAAAVPCITTDTGDSRQILDGAGLAVEPGNAHALAQGILTVLEDADRAARMRAAAQQLVDTYSWDKLVQTFVSIYRAS